MGGLWVGRKLIAFQVVSRGGRYHAEGRGASGESIDTGPYDSRAEAHNAFLIRYAIGSSN